MPQRVEHINKDIIEWAILRAGKDPQEFYAQNTDVAGWIADKKKPTVKQLERFTKKVHVPFGYMFLSEPPQETLPMPFFRTGKKKPSQRVDLNIFHTVQILQKRQDWLTDYLTAVDFPDLEFVGQFNKDTPYKVIVEDIRETLHLDKGWAEQYRNWEETLHALTEKIEEIGIIVSFSGTVGNNTHRTIDVKQCRGFVLVNKKAPFLFVNSRDAKAAQMFTLIHELAHIWLGESAGFDNGKMLPADDPIELLCDQVAAEFLVPEESLYTAWEKTSNFRTLSRKFKVSPIVIGRRAMDLSLITKKKFFEFYKGYMEDFRQRKERQAEKASGGNFYATTRKRISPRFAGLVHRAVKEDKLLYREAYQLTALKGKTYDKFMNEKL